MAERRCTFKCGDWNCGSYQFNLYKDDIDQGEFCDVHYWQTKAQPTPADYAMGYAEGFNDACKKPEQEPVALRDALAEALTGTYVCGRVWSAWNVGTMTEDDFQRADECNELLDGLVQAVAATSPPQRPWVGLTDEEINDTWKKWVGTDRANKSYTLAIEAKLKEKNYGF